MAEEEKTKSTETTSGPNKNVKAPEVVIALDSWDGVPNIPVSGNNQQSEKNKK